MTDEDTDRHRGGALLKRGRLPSGERTGLGRNEGAAGKCRFGREAALAWKAALSTSRPLLARSDTER